MKQNELKQAYFASGCFWGAEYYFSKATGVEATKVGFMGGSVDDPSYKQVCEKNTGHLEVTELFYHPEVVSYEVLVKLFFEIHDFTQIDGQGPDIGPQYLSVIFYSSPEEQRIAQSCINQLQAKGYAVATELRPASTFWVAEDYHQQYYEHQGSTPYCHVKKKIFD